MHTLDTENPICVNSLKLLGDYWTLRIIDTLSDGEVRYCEIQRQADGVNPVTLSNRLKKLEEAQLIERRESPDAHAVAYSLSSLGREALPLLEAVNKFGQASKAHLAKSRG